MMPCLSERTRKRRAFADTELDAVMMERERLVVTEAAQKLKPPGPVNPSGAPFHLLDPARSRQLLGQLGPREFLQRIFPTANPNVLELVYQGCGGSLEKTIEQLVSNNAVSQMQAAHFAQQQALLHQQGKLLQPSAAHQKQPSAFVRPAGNHVSPVRPPPAHMGLQGLQAAYLAYPLLPMAGRLPYPFLIPKMPDSGSHGIIASNANAAKELLEEKSAFHPRAQDTEEADTSPSPSLSRSPSPVRQSTASKITSPIKFSVASIIGEKENV